MKERLFYRIKTLSTTDLNYRIANIFSTIEQNFDKRAWNVSINSTQLKWHATIFEALFRRAIQQFCGTHLLTRLVQHETFIESSPIRACSYT
jgi:hypothetical protein